MVIFHLENFQSNYDDKTAKIIKIFDFKFKK